MTLPCLPGKHASAMGNGSASAIFTLALFALSPLQRLSMRFRSTIRSTLKRTTFGTKWVLLPPRAYAVNTPRSAAIDKTANLETR